MYTEFTNQIASLNEVHPLRVYFEENEFLKKLIDEIQSFPPETDFPRYINILNQICEVEKRYTRKENQLFPYLEKRGWFGPSQGMWAFHDSIRDIIRMIRLSLQKQDIANLKEDVSQLLENMLHMMSVEEMRLFPNAHSILLEEDWNAMIEGEAEIGWVDKDRSKIGADMAETTNNKNDIHTLTDIFMKLDEGRVTKEQVNLIFKYLPVDITFVDENDKVAFYNRGDLRVFPRSAGVIGREVRFCHPPKSVGTVLKILEEFKAGRKDESEFWIQFKERLIHIRYFAVRDENNKYKGVLEMSQDVTGIQKLQGEKRLLNWDN